MIGNNNEIEKRLWTAADTLRANSNYASNEYFIPVMGLIFLRHAYSRFLLVKDDIEKNLPSRGGQTRELRKEDFSQKTAIFLRPEAQFEHLVNLKDSDDRAKAIIAAMRSIESDYDGLKGVLPKPEYQELDNDVLGNLLRILNPEELKHANGDVFGKIYEYFLTQFADLKAHDNGEFFTPISLVSMIANVLEPKEGIILDPACGSGGMFVQSAHFVERLKQNPVSKLTFKGMEKNATTIRLAKMNLAVHGLEGDIQKAITYYEDPHELFGKADFVMANPPFNVDEVDAEKVKNDPRLPFGLPGVNKKKKISNGNFLWISYFYSYLNKHGKAGFVMSSQASSAGKDEAKIRQKLIESGAVDIMMSIRSNFFYTRTVPCELWFLNKAKPKEYEDKVLLINCRNIYRKVTRRVYDFSPEQEKNILAITWLYRGETERFLELLANYCEIVLEEADKCFSESPKLEECVKALKVMLEKLKNHNFQTSVHEQISADISILNTDIGKLSKLVEQEKNLWKNKKHSLAELKKTVNSLSFISENSQKLVKSIYHIYNQFGQLLEDADDDNDGNGLSRDISKVRKETDEIRLLSVKQIKKIRYFWMQAHWLVDKFPEGRIRNVEGLVKLVDRKEIGTEDNNWGLTPGRYVGVAPEEEDPDFNFQETIKNIHQKLDDLNKKSIEISNKILDNLKGLNL
jgi:type I restriction enzyme M protein